MAMTSGKPKSHDQWIMTSGNPHYTMTHVSPQHATHVIIIIIVHCIHSGISNVISVIIIVIISIDVISIFMPI